MGVPIAAMNTGGTGDILTHEQDALLSASVNELGDHVRRLIEDGALRTRLAANAHDTAVNHFATPAVLDRVEELYRSLLPT